MTAKTRKPFTFDENRHPATPAAPVKKQGATVERKQVGARITAATYRQLKAKAALQGVPVAVLVEQAIDQFLAAQP